MRSDSIALKLFGWEYKPRSSLCTHAFHHMDSERFWHSCPRWVNAGTKNTPSMHHLWRENVTTLMVGLKNSLICKNLTQTGEPQGYSWETQKKKKENKLCLSCFQLDSLVACIEIFSSPSYVFIHRSKIWICIMLLFSVIQLTCKDLWYMIRPLEDVTLCHAWRKLNMVSVLWPSALRKIFVGNATDFVVVGIHRRSWRMTTQCTCGTTQNWRLFWPTSCSSCFWGSQMMSLPLLRSTLRLSPPPCQPLLLTWPRPHPLLSPIVVPTHR